MSIIQQNPLLDRNVIELGIISDHNDAMHVSSMHANGYMTNLHGEELGGGTMVQGMIAGVMDSRSDTVKTHPNASNAKYTGGNSSNTAQFSTPSPTMAGEISTLGADVSP